MADGNSIPVLAADQASVSEDDVLNVAGNVLGNDSDVDGDTLVVTAVNGVPAGVGSTIAGVYGSLVLGANGQYVYTLNNAQPNVQALGAGQVVSDVFRYTISDGQDHSTTVTATNLLTQSEAFNVWSRFAVSGAQPSVTTNVAANPVGSGTTVDQVTISGATAGLYSNVSVSGTHTFSVWVKLVSGNGAFSFNYYGAGQDHLQTAVATSQWQRFTFTFDGVGNPNDNVALMHSSLQSATGVFQVFGAQLNAGASADPYVATSGSPVTTTTTTIPDLSADLTIQIAGAADVANSAPVVVADAASVSEDGVTSAAGNVLANDTDADADALHVVSINGSAAIVGTSIAGVYGSLVLAADGSYTYTLNNSQPNVQALGAGETVTEVFHYTVSDAHDHSTTITATNLLSRSEAFDTWSRFTVGSTQPSVVTNVAANPVGAGATVDQVTISGPTGGLYSNVSLSGQHTFSVWVKLVSGNGAFSFNYYGAGQDHLQSAVATSEWQRFTFTFDGVGNPNDNIALMHSSLQSGTSVLQIFGAQLNAGSSADPYVATNGSPISMPVTTTPDTSADLTITITGADDAPNVAPVAVADAAAVSEDGVLSATGNVLSNDTDANGDVLSVSAVNGAAASVGSSIAGTYGTLVLGADGSYSYTLANGQANVQALAAGQTVTDVFRYTLSDAHAHTTNVPVTNYIPQSEAFETWNRFAVGSTQPSVLVDVAANPAAAGSNVDQVTLSGVTTGIYSNVAVSGQFTFSVWVKLVSGSGAFSFNYYGAGQDHLQSAVATSEWQRFTFTFNGLGNPNDNVALMHSGSQSGTSVFQVYGAQLNAGASADPYLATHGQAASGSVAVPAGDVTADLTVTITGAAEPVVNVLPVAVADAAAVSEDGVLSATGNVLTNDTDGDGDALSVASVNGQAALLGTSIAGVYGSLVLQANGSYAYTLANGQANVQALAAGQTVTEVFSYAVSDGQDHGGAPLPTSNLTVTITGAAEPVVNVLPVAVADAAAVSEDGVLSASGNVLTNDTDGDGDVLSVASVSGQAALLGTSIAGVYGSLVLQANGSYAYTLANNQANVQALAAGQTVTEVFSYAVSDGQDHGGAPLPTSNLTITITGAAEPVVNVLPVAVADAASVSEDGVLSASGNVLTNDTDGDGDVLSVASVNGQAALLGTSIAGVYGSLVLQANGSYAYTLANGQANVQALAAGQTVTDVFSYAVSDGQDHGGAPLPTSNLTITITGAAEPVVNVLPVAVADAASVSEDGVLSASGNVLTNDTDGDGDVLSVASVNGQAALLGTSIAGVYGSLVLQANGSYAYTLANNQANVQALAAGQTVTEVFSYAVSDGQDHGGAPLPTSNLTITITGAAEPVVNVLPVAVADAASVSEDGVLSASGNVLTNDTDGDGDVLSVASVNGQAALLGTSIAGVYGSLVLQANGSYAYTLANGQANVQALAAGQTVTDVFSYAVSDGQDHGGAPLPTSNLTITITGAAEPVVNVLPVAVADAASVSEDGVLSASGNVLTNDTDGDGDVLSVASVNGQAALLGTSIAGVYGSLVLQANGSYAYTLANGQANVQALAAGQTVTEVFSYAVSDGQDHGGAPLPTSNLTITITGAAEAGPNLPPAIVADVANVSEDGVLSAGGNVLANDSDPNGDVLSVTAVNGVAANVGATIAGTYGTLVLGANGAYNYVLNNGAANVQALAAGQTVAEVFHYTASDGFNHTTTTTATNLIAQSEAFNTWNRFAVSTAQPVVTANVSANPVGTGNTVDRVSLAGADTGIYYNMSLTGQHTFSAWVRVVSGDGNFSFNYYGADEDYLQHAVATSQWQRFSFTFDALGGQFDNVAIMHDFTQGSASVLEIFGAQVNAGAAPDPYIATTGSATTSTVTTSANTTGDLTILITGADDQPNAKPVAVSDAASVTEDGVLAASGNVLANDSDADHDVLSVVKVNGVSAAVGTTISGEYGSLTLNADGSYSYVLNNGQANVQSLPGGKSVTDVFHYTVSDAQDHSALTTVTNLQPQSEAFNNWISFRDTGPAPVISTNVAANPVGTGTTVDQVTLTGANTGLFYGQTLAGLNTFSVWIKLVSGSGDFSFNYYGAGSDHLQSAVATGEWQRFTFTFDGIANVNDNIAIMHDASQTGTSVFQMFGAQINAGGVALPYVPTGGSIASAQVLVPSEVTADLSITVTGADDGGTQLSFAGTHDGTIVDLSAGAWSEALKVLPLGDSITYGWKNSDFTFPDGLSDGYRAPLWWDFASNDMLIDFVGSQSTGTGTSLDLDHAGYPGFRTDQILANMPDILAINDPDVILMMAGTNDMFQLSQQDAVASIRANVTAMLNETFAHNADAKVFVSELLVASSVSTGELNAANAALLSIVQEFSSAGHAVYWVDTSSITLSDMYDGVHPTAAGDAKLATLWYNAIMDVLPNVGGTPGGTAHAISPTVVSITGSEANDLLIGDARANQISGGAGNDRIVGNGGNDVLTGGLGHDQFVFGSLASHAVVTDFQTAQADVLVFDHIQGLSTFQNLASHISVVNGSTILDLTSFGIDQTVTLQGFNGSLGASDFLFT